MHYELYYNIQQENNFGGISFLSSGIVFLLSLTVVQIIKLIKLDGIIN